jgi:hypothetical protein
MVKNKHNYEALTSKKSVEWIQQDYKGFFPPLITFEMVSCLNKFRKLI